MQYFLSKLEEADCLDEHKLYALVKRLKEPLENPMRKQNQQGASFLCYKNGSLSFVEFKTAEEKKVLFEVNKDNLSRIFYRPDVFSLGISALLTMKDKSGEKLVLEILGKQNRKACKDMVKKIKK